MLHCKVVTLVLAITLSLLCTINAVNIQDVEWWSDSPSLTSGSLLLHSSIVLPSSPPPQEGYSAVLLIAGSGPNNRWERVSIGFFSADIQPPHEIANYGYCYYQSLEFNTFYEIANHIANTTNQAVLVYDKRSCLATHSSICKYQRCNKRENITENCLEVNKLSYNDFTYDAISAVQYLRTRNDINPDDITVIGHSQGTWIAPYVAVATNLPRVMQLMGGGTTYGALTIRQLMQNSIRDMTLGYGSFCDDSNQAQHNLKMQARKNLELNQKIISADSGFFLKLQNNSIHLPPYTPINLGIGTLPFIFVEQQQNQTEQAEQQRILNAFMSASDNNLLLSLNSPTDQNLLPVDFLPLKQLIDSKLPNKRAKHVTYNFLTHMLSDSGLQSAHVQQEVLDLIANFVQGKLPS